MRKAKKQIRDKKVIDELLHASHVGRLGTVGPDGRPMIKPLNFAYDAGKIYFHSAREGEKIEHIQNDPRVCFEVDQPVALVKARENPCDCMYLYRSVIVKGTARIVEDEGERMKGLGVLMRKYQPEGGWGEYTEGRLGLTEVVCIDIYEMTGKEDLGREKSLRDAAFAALERGLPLPVVIER